MSGLVIFFAVVRGGGTVCVCSQFVEFGSSLVRIVWQSVPSPLLRLSIRHSFYFLHCSIVNTLPRMAPRCISCKLRNGLLGGARIG